MPAGVQVVVQASYPCYCRSDGSKCQEYAFASVFAGISQVLMCERHSEHHRYMLSYGLYLPTLVTGKACPSTRLSRVCRHCEFGGE
jgi:hypothetical protein